MGDADLWTPLHHAAYLNRVDAIILLIRRGAMLNVLDTNSKTPLDVAIEHLRAHCVTLLRLAMHAESEHPGNALEDEPINSTSPTSVSVREQFRKGTTTQERKSHKP